MLAPALRQPDPDGDPDRSGPKPDAAGGVPPLSETDQGRSGPETPGGDARQGHPRLGEAGLSEELGAIQEADPSLGEAEKEEKQGILAIGFPFFYLVIKFGKKERHRSAKSQPIAGEDSTPQPNRVRLLGRQSGRPPHKEERDVKLATE